MEYESKYHILKRKYYTKGGIDLNAINCYRVSLCGFETLETLMDYPDEPLVGEWNDKPIDDEILFEFHICKKCAKTHNKKLKNK